MTHTGGNKDARPRPNRYQFVVELHRGVTLALQNIIRLGQSLVVMQLGVLGDLCAVQRAGKVGPVDQRPAGKATRTLGGGNLVEINDLETSFCLIDWSIPPVRHFLNGLLGLNARIIATVYQILG